MPRDAEYCEVQPDGTQVKGKEPGAQRGYILVNIFGAQFTNCPTDFKYFSGIVKRRHVARETPTCFRYTSPRSTFFGKILRELGGNINLNRFAILMTVSAWLRWFAFFSFLLAFFLFTNHVHPPLEELPERKWLGVLHIKSISSPSFLRSTSVLYRKARD